MEDPGSAAAAHEGAQRDRSPPLCVKGSSEGLGGHVQEQPCQFIVDLRPR